MSTILAREVALELRELEDVRRRTDARQLELLVELAAHYRVGHDDIVEALVEGFHRFGGDGTPTASEFLPLEVGALLRCTPGKAGCLIADALNLRYRHEVLWDAVQRLELEADRACRAAHLCHSLPTEAATWVSQQWLGKQAGLGWTAAFNLLEKLIIQADPDAAAQREAAALEARDVFFWRARDGVAAISGSLDVLDAKYLDSMINQVADCLQDQHEGPENATASRGVLRAKALAALGSPAYALSLLQTAAQQTLPIGVHTPNPIAPATAPPATTVQALPPARQHACHCGTDTYKAPDSPPHEPQPPRPHARTNTHGLPVETCPTEAAEPVDAPSHPPRQAPTHGDDAKHTANPDITEQDTKPPAPHNEAPPSTTPTNSTPQRTPEWLAGLREPDNPYPAEPPSAWNHLIRPERRPLPPTDPPDPEPTSTTWAPPGEACPLTPHAPSPTEPKGEPRNGARAEALNPHASGTHLPGHACGTITVPPTKLLPRLTLNVHLTIDPDGELSPIARVEHAEHITTATLAKLLDGRQVRVQPVIDLPQTPAEDAYTPSTKLRRAVTLAYEHDMFPYATAPVSSCDLDHTEAYLPGRRGQTRLDNLGPINRRAHRAKTAGAWTLRQVQALHWTSPLGLEYLVTPDQTHPVNLPTPAQLTG